MEGQHWQTKVTDLGEEKVLLFITSLECYHHAVFLVCLFSKPQNFIQKQDIQLLFRTKML